MANKKFTKEDMNHLRANPYVLDVSPSIVGITLRRNPFTVT
ncbi:MAG TPA: HTH domain-containing protein [Desulfosporosinus sp.]|nr:HTH domain-containing protein [Desulfosporosinus sp.]